MLPRFLPSIPRRSDRRRPASRPALHRSRHRRRQVFFRYRNRMSWAPPMNGAQRLPGQQMKTLSVYRRPAQRPYCAASDVRASWTSSTCCSSCRSDGRRRLAHSDGSPAAPRFVFHRIHNHSATCDLPVAPSWSNKANQRLTAGRNSASSHVSVRRPRASALIMPRKRWISGSRKPARWITILILCSML